MSSQTIKKEKFEKLVQRGLDSHTFLSGLHNERRACLDSAETQIMGFPPSFTAPRHKGGPPVHGAETLIALPSFTINTQPHWLGPAMGSTAERKRQSRGSEAVVLLCPLKVPSAGDQGAGFVSPALRTTPLILYPS